LSDDNDEPEIPLASQDAIVLWGAYMGLLKKWDSQNALGVLKSLEQHKSINTARSGINKVSSRIVTRDSDTKFPSDFKGY
jgi:hypothetical protein